MRKGYEALVMQNQEQQKLQKQLSNVTAPRMRQMRLSVESDIEGIGNAKRAL
jgi:hypothetical protein